MQSVNNIISRPDTVDFADALSIGHVLINNLTKNGDRTVLVSGETGKTLSAIEVLSKSIVISKSLLATGIGPGDVVSIVSENRFEFIFALFGTMFLNRPIAPLNHTYSDRELEHSFNLSKPKYVFASASTAESVLRAVKNLSYVKKIILFDDIANESDGRITKLEDFSNPKLIQNVKFEPSAVNTLTTTCLIMCSSGTTGFPKGVQLSQSNVMLGAYHGASYIKPTSTSADDSNLVALGLLPIFHAYGISILTCMLGFTSGRLILLKKFEEKLFLETIEKYRCVVAFLVPPLMIFLSKNQLVGNYDLSSLRLITCGAAPLSKETEFEVRNRLNNPNLIVKQGYGLTELTGAAGGVLSSKGLTKPGSVGEVNTGVSAKVVDDNGKTLGPNQKGELCFKGSLMMLGYINDESATKATIDEEGWLHTGDIGYFDEDLQFYVVDRIKELIKWKGFQVPPAEIEALLVTHPMIKEAGVVGKPDEVAGELPLAFVVKANPNLKEEDVILFVRDRTSPAKRLHGGVIFVDEIPKNPSGKILRRKLRELLQQHELKSKL
ncbi:luciferin 4-monooxygenase-like [Bradysia coprophila]|uniref:luciferin 4-monooxygenase-like n=1 Tax=Bradysia coprophila TaxID=38358 RepID=UPI00187DD09C|nr:luciferin 4-monooxygenase-like [Bradysia coprophila]XP_037042999.1 luciferin 4-monooxygenase-like [Bradysia coprophila]